MAKSTKKTHLDCGKYTACGVDRIGRPITKKREEVTCSRCRSTLWMRGVRDCN